MEGYKVAHSVEDPLQEHVSGEFSVDQHQLWPCSIAVRLREI